MRGPVDRLTENWPRPWRIAVDWIVTIVGAVVDRAADQGVRREPVPDPVVVDGADAALREARAWTARPTTPTACSPTGSSTTSPTRPGRTSSSSTRRGRAQEQCGAGGTFVKRIIGLPGDTVTVLGNGKVVINGKPLDETGYIENDRLGGESGTWQVPEGRHLRDGRQPPRVVRFPRLGAAAEERADRQGLRDLLAAEAHRLPVTARRLRRLRYDCEPGPPGLFLYAERDRQPRAAPAAHGPPAVQGRGHGARSLPGDRGPAPPRAGLRGHRHQAPGRRRARDVHRPQAVVRRRRRAHVPGALAQDREDRGAGDRRREPREALLPARQGRQEGPRPRDPRRPPAMAEQQLRPPLQRGRRAPPPRRRGGRSRANGRRGEPRRRRCRARDRGVAEPRRRHRRAPDGGRATAPRPRPRAAPRSSSPRSWTTRLRPRLPPISSGAPSGFRLPRRSSWSCAAAAADFFTYGAPGHLDRQIWFFIASTAAPRRRPSCSPASSRCPSICAHAARIAARWNRCGSSAAALLLFLVGVVICAIGAIWSAADALGNSPFSQ